MERQQESQEREYESTLAGSNQVAGVPSIPAMIRSAHLSTFLDTIHVDTEQNPNTSSLTCMLVDQRQRQIEMLIHLEVIRRDVMS